MHPDKHNIRQVQLPSGKVIDVVYFADHRPRGADAPTPPAAQTPPPRATPGADGDLHVCPVCEGRLVYPLDWNEVGSAHWEVSLRCPECEWHDTGRFSQATVERFDIELDRGAESLLDDLQQLAHANMADQIERFVHALDADHIVPSDF